MKLLELYFLVVMLNGNVGILIFIFMEVIR